MWSEYNPLFFDLMDLNCIIVLQGEIYDNGELNIYYISSDFLEEGRTKYIKDK